METAIQSLPRLLDGALLTLLITIGSVAIGCVLGLIAGLSRLSGNRVLRILATAYVDFFRGTPSWYDARASHAVHHPAPGVQKGYSAPGK